MTRSLGFTVPKKCQYTHSKLNKSVCIKESNWKMRKVIEKTMKAWAREYLRSSSSHWLSREWQYQRIALSARSKPRHFRSRVLLNPCLFIYMMYMTDDRFLLFWKYAQTNRFHCNWGTRQKRYKNKNIIIITSKESRVDHYDDDRYWKDGLFSQQFFVFQTASQCPPALGDLVR